QNFHSITRRRAPAQSGRFRTTLRHDEAYLFYFPSHSFISLFNLSVASLRVQPIHKDLCSQVCDSGETVPALKIQYQSFGRSGPDIWSTYTNPTMNRITSILFILVSYSS